MKRSVIIETRTEQPRLHYTDQILKDQPRKILQRRRSAMKRESYRDVRNGELLPADLRIGH